MTKILNFEQSALIKNRAEERAEFLLGMLKQNMSEVENLPEGFWEGQRKTIFEAIYSSEKLKAKMNASDG